jgi:hypothetical protein
MVQPSSSSRRGDVRLASRVSQSPPLGLAGGGVAILVMVLALAGVVPRAIFFVAAAGLIFVAHQLDKRFKGKAPAAPPESLASPLSPPGSPTPAPSTAAPSTPAATPSAPPLSAGDLQAEHARLTQELTDRVDADEDVRFEKFMRLRAIEQQLSQQPPPGT